MTRSAIWMASLVLLLNFSCKNKNQTSPTKDKKDSMVLLTVKPFSYNDGWGYDILADNKIYIHQDQVPAIFGKHIFLTKEDAQKAGNIVVQKMITTGLPSIDSMDLVNADIQYK